MPDVEKQAENNLKKVEKRLKKLEHHKFRLQPSKSGELVLLMEPWGDESLGFIGFEEGTINEGLFKTLEKVRLPNELSAIFHIEENVLEVIWTAYKLDSSSKEVAGREFTFSISGREYNCRFSRSSEELLELSRHAAYLQMSSTTFRNLQSFSIFTNDDAHKDKNMSERLGEPISFFIENLSDDHEEWFEVISNLNFYLKYYDSESPFIIIHDNEEEGSHKRVRYLEDNFPKSINARPLNGTLLALWTAAYDHDITTKFLLYYRILEYVAGSYLQAKQRQSLKRILSSPTAQSDLDRTLDSVAHVVRLDSTNEFDRFIHVFKDLVSVEKIWKQICLDPDAFTMATEFDGGLTLDALLENTNSISSFGPDRVGSLAGMLRRIRHALAHGGEQQAGQLILPTNRNFDMLLPWMHVARVAAGEVLIYEHLG